MPLELIVVKAILPVGDIKTDADHNLANPAGGDDGYEFHVICRSDRTSRDLQPAHWQRMSICAPWTVHLASSLSVLMFPAVSLRAAGGGADIVWQVAQPHDGVDIHCATFLDFSVGNPRRSHLRSTIVLYENSTTGSRPSTCIPNSRRNS